MKITVAGAGYVGLVTGVCLAEAGHDVICVDVDAQKIALLRRGVLPIYEAGLEALLQKNDAHLTFTTDPQQAYCEADVILIGVGTPEAADGSCDLTHVYAVADEIVRWARNEPVVVVKSTVPVGTCHTLQNHVNSSLGGRQLRVASNPEFLSQGTAVRDTLHATRIVVGADDAQTAEVLRAMYAPFGLPMVETDVCSAEMIKYASNAFLALKISFINEIANLCEAVGADVTDVAAGMGLDPRIGDAFLRAGIGYGGSCFPKDTEALCHMAQSRGRTLRTVRAAIEVNEAQTFMQLEKAQKYYPSLRGVTVALLGLAFKPGTDDVRGAPSQRIAAALLEKGARIRAWDAAAAGSFAAVFPDILYCDTPYDALRDAQLCLILTEWEEIRALRPADFAAHMKRPIVIDGRNCFSPTLFRASGVTYESFGRAAVQTSPGKEGQNDE